MRIIENGLDIRGYKVSDTCIRCRHKFKLKLFDLKLCAKDYNGDDCYLIQCPICGNKVWYHKSCFPPYVQVVLSQRLDKTYGFIN